MGESEKRQTERFEVNCKVDLKILFTKSNDLKEVKAQLKNAGLGGLCVETREIFETGALADLDVALPDGSVANTLGLVRWVKPGEGIGIEFFYGSDEARDQLAEAVRRWAERAAQGRARTPPPAS